LHIADQSKIDTSSRDDDENMEKYTISAVSGDEDDLLPK